MDQEQDVTVSVTTRLPVSLVQRLRQRAKDEGRTQSWYIRRGLEKVLAEKPDRRG